MEFGIWWILVKRCHGSLMDLMGEQGRSCRSSHVVLSRVPGVRIQDDPRTAVDPNDCKGMGTQGDGSLVPRVLRNHRCFVTNDFLEASVWNRRWKGKALRKWSDVSKCVQCFCLSLSLCELCQRPSHSGFLRDQGQHMNLKLHTSLSLLLCSFLVFFLFLFFLLLLLYLYIYMCVYRYSKRFSFD